MAKYVSVEGNPSLVRDKVSGAILNINSNEAQRARARKKSWVAEKEEVDQLKKDVHEIKSLLKQILEATNGDNNS
jgi:hypothetical protein